MKSFFLFCALLFLYAFIGQRIFFTDDTVDAVGELFVLSYVAFLIHFIIFLAFSMYVHAIIKAGGKRAERIAVYYVIAPYLALTWRFKYLPGPIFSYELQVVIAAAIVIVWWLLSASMLEGFKRFAVRGMGGDESAILPGKDGPSQLTNMRLITAALLVVPIPFWHVGSIFK